MNLILISPPYASEGETSVVNALFALGLERFHLRKPEMKIHEAEQYLSAIEEKFHSKIVLHQHHELVRKFALGGMHFKSSVPMTECKSKEAGFTVSCSVHSFDEVKEKEDKVDYMFLGPVFDSISKAAYHSKFELPVLKDFLSEQRKCQIVAIGGVNENNIEELIDCNFSGAALLGAVWNGAEGKEQERFKIILNKVKITA
jgi:thiamine-phosphate pyrophosphorylase